MSNLTIDQKNILELFSSKKNDFLIPDYQRPYAWTENECQTLWEDMFLFSFPDEDYSKFNSNDEYFLGPIVTFKNDEDKTEIIDGQQRLTTLMLLLRAFYTYFGNMKDEDAISTSKSIERCIWKTDEFDKPNKNELKINSEVASDDDKDEFLEILKSGVTTEEMKSKYAINYKFFKKKINEFLARYPSYFPYFPNRILKNCILLPIEAENQDSALRIFSTLNDRGLPLSDADIFKSQLYKYYSKKGEKEKFVEEWKNLEERVEKIFHQNPMNELFTEYMYFERAKSGIKSSTTEALRKFYEKDKYSLLKNDYVFENLKQLTGFWEDIFTLNIDKFENKSVLKNLFILNYAPNGIWTYILSVYFMKYKDNWNNILFEKFLEKIIAFIWAYAFINPGVNSLRTPIYAEMINIIENTPVTFNNFKFNSDTLINILKIYEFSNRKPITKSMLAWWVFQDKNQEILSFDTVLEIEHIFSKNRQANEKSLNNDSNLEVLGNKSLLEKRINIRASDYKFNDKKKYYLGYTKNGIIKEKTHINELIELTAKEDFTEKDIIERNNIIINKFIEYLEKEDLLIK